MDQEIKKKNLILPGDPVYPPIEDICNNNKEEENIDPENISKKKRLNKTDLSFKLLGNDLDVPGADLDDAEENIGSEDEENNYYSLGGDEHNDLEEDRPE